MLGGCSDTLIGGFISPTYTVSSIDDLERLGVSFAPESPDKPKAICATRYDREFAPIGEHYRLENWQAFATSVPADFAAANLDVEAIIDVDTGRYDFGEVALIWKASGDRVKVYVTEQVGGALLFPQMGCILLPRMAD